MNNKSMRINYAYPTSNVASAQGYFNSGCYYLAICTPDTAKEDDADKDEIVYSSLDIEDVINHSKQYDFTWHHYSHYKGDK